ncbi:MAG: hypothetical protein ABT940_03525 [Alphaproteobacteria bacterium]
MGIGTVIVSREKTEIGPSTAKVPKDFRFVLRSNRMAVTLTNPPITEKLVVRGQTLTSTLRMAGGVIALFLRDKTAFRRKEYTPDLAAIWARVQSPYERVYSPDSWISVHLNGLPLLASSLAEVLDPIEALAKGGDLTDNILKKALADMLAENKNFSLRHESQTAIVMTESTNNVKCAILERGAGQKRSISFAVATDKTPIPIPVMLSTASDFMEAINLSEFLTPARLAPKPQGGYPSSGGPTDAQVEAAVARKRQLSDVIRGFEKAYRVHYRPERPACLEPATPAPANPIER